MIASMFLNPSRWLAEAFRRGEQDRTTERAAKSRAFDLSVRLSRQDNRLALRDLRWFRHLEAELADQQVAVAVKPWFIRQDDLDVLREVDLLVSYWTFRVTLYYNERGRVRKVRWDWPEDFPYRSAFAHPLFFSVVKPHGFETPYRKIPRVLAEIAHGIGIAKAQGRYVHRFNDDNFKPTPPAPEYEI